MKIKLFFSQFMIIVSCGSLVFSAAGQSDVLNELAREVAAVEQTENIFDEEFFAWLKKQGEVAEHPLAVLDALKNLDESFYGNHLSDRSFAYVQGEDKELQDEVVPEVLCADSIELGDGREAHELFGRLKSYLLTVRERYLAASSCGEAFDESECVVDEEWLDAGVFRTKFVAQEEQEVLKLKEEIKAFFDKTASASRSQEIALKIVVAKAVEEERRKHETGLLASARSACYQYAGYVSKAGIIGCFYFLNPALGLSAFVAARLQNIVLDYVISMTLGNLVVSPRMYKVLKGALKGLYE